MTDKVQKIREEVEKLYNQSLADENRQADRGLERAANVSYGKSKACKELLSFIDSLQEEPVSEDLGYYINELSKQFPEVSFAKLSRIAVRVAKWQKEHLWKPADGDDLPEYKREVVVLTQPYPLENSEYAVSFAHRPNPNGWNGKSVTTGKVEHYTPKTYDKGSWNIPNVKYWLDCLLPNMED